MTFKLLALFAPIIGLALLIAGHLLCFRLAPSLNAIGALGAGLILGLLALLAIQAMAGSSLGDGAASLLSYLALAYAYFHFVNMSRTARRIRILYETAQSPDGISREELVSRYNAREMINRRIQRLLEAGQASMQDGRLYAGNQAMFGMARVIAFFKRLLYPGR